MVSLIVLSSEHREHQLKQLIECLEDNPDFKYYQKILIFDGDLKSLSKVFSSYSSQNFTSQWEISKAERIDGLYCWANALNEGIERANFDKILYLDGDRIINQKFLSEVKNVKDKEFVVPKNLYTLNATLTTDEIRKLRNDQTFVEKLMWKDFREMSNPDKSFCKKNPMSGCVGFTKKTYLRTGGFDPMFVGYGYPDIDYFRKTYNLGCKFRSVDCAELHLYHSYFPLTIDIVKLHGFWNGIKYCEKWGLEIPKEIKSSGNSLGLTIKDTKGFHFLEIFEEAFNNGEIGIKSIKTL